MVKYFIFLIMLFISIESYALSGKVISVSDGDTLTILTNDKKKVRIRLLNIDAPELNQPYGDQAKWLLNKLVYSRQVYIDESGKDIYNRILGTVYYGQTNINKQMVFSGYAWAYRKGLNDKSYISLEKTAKDNKRGLWQDNNPIDPKLWRSSKK